MNTPISFRRWLWGLTGLYLLLIYTTLPVMPRLVKGLWSVLGRGTVDQLFNGLVAGAGLVTALLVGRLPPRRRWGSLMALAVTAGLAWQLDNPAERVHFLEYAVLGILLWLAVARPGWRGLLAALLLAALAGLLDEGIQWFLPNRYWDLRDVAFNAVGGALGVWLGLNARPDPRPANGPPATPAANP